MDKADSLFSTKKGWLFILTTAVVVVSLLAIPGNLKAYADETEELYFCILHTNDMHSELVPHSPAADYRPGEENDAVGGFARMAAAISEIRAAKMSEGEPVLLFDDGDFLGGGPFAWLALNGSAPELSIILEMGYDAVTIGNHEYDYGPDILAQYLLQAGYPEAHGQAVMLASNMEAPSSHPLAAQGLYKETAMFELENGVKVGVFGLIGKDATIVTADTGDVEFSDQHETARQMVDKLEQQGADVIVVLSHSGVKEDRELAQEVEGIDIIVGGHCHTALFEPILEGSTIIVQAGALGMYLGRLELAFNPDSGQLRLRNEENDHSFLIPIDSSLASDPEIDALVDEYILNLNTYIEGMTDGGFDDVMSTVARSDFILSNDPALSETALGNFVTDAMRFVGEEFTGEKVDIASQASGNIRKSVFPGTMEYSAGNISLYEILEATGIGRGLDSYPGCPIASVHLTGEEVRRVLEITVLLQKFMGDSYFLHFSGLRYSYNPTNAVLLTVPFVDLPIPTTRAVTAADLYTGDGIQPADGEGYVPVKRGDEELYHVVTDAYLLLFLPLVTDLLPQLEVVPKNAAGEPVPLDRITELVIHHPDGRELKVWEAVLMYAAAQPAGAHGVAQIPDYYAAVAGRINKVWTFPLLGWLIIILVVVVGGVVFLVLRRKKRKKSREAAAVKPATG
jgi:5'-nucleotidase / UDP-sugar diphosphatase